MRPPALLFLAILSLLSLTHALPLNINLGAYSPALVVGDGAISFKGAEGAGEGEGGARVEQIVNALQGAAIEGAVGVAQANTSPNTNTNAAATAPPGAQAAAVVQVEDEPTAKILDPRP
ncbi:hypothetical protein VTI74DRAFT_2972 [Chaetomium olivicolor]